MADTRRDDRGQSLVEFALVIPIVLLLMLGLLDLGRVVFTNNALGDGARQGARVASVDPRRATYCGDVEVAVRTAIRGQTLTKFTVTYQTLNADGTPTASVVVCQNGSPKDALPSLARPGDRVIVALGTGVTLATPLVAAATGQSDFSLANDSTMTVTFAPSTP